MVNFLNYKTTPKWLHSLKKFAFLSQSEIATKNFVLYNKSSAEDWKQFVGDVWERDRETERQRDPTLLYKEKDREIPKL